MYKSYRNIGIKSEVPILKVLLISTPDIAQHSIMIMHCKVCTCTAYIGSLVVNTISYMKKKPGCDPNGLPTSSSQQKC